MTAGEKMSDQRDCGGDAAAYVLGALEPEELEAFRLHMEGCAACREEVAALQQVADALPATAPPVAAPAERRRRVIEAVSDEPKDAAPATDEPGEPGPRPVPRPRRRRFAVPRPVAVVAAVVAAALVIAGVVVLATGGSSGTRVIHASVVGPGAAELRVTGDRGELVVSHFRVPPTGRIYQVWLARPHEAPAPTSTLFSVTTDGNGEVGLAGDLHGVSEVLVTAEPLGGSPAPTTTPLITARLG
jgi:anti-sigma-K factor RskA